MKFVTVDRSRFGPTGVWDDMRQKGTGFVLVSEADLRELVRDEVRNELRHHRVEILEALRGLDKAPPMNEPNPDELLTVEQVAQLLKVIPDTVRTWIQSGALRASRPGDGTRPGRKYRVRRSDMDAFVAASQHRPAPPEVVAVSEPAGISVG
jgi:excisionase family DNA binding protein